MVTPSVGYALFDDYNSSPCSISVAKTVNGGATFHHPVQVQRVSCNSLAFGGAAIATDTVGDVFVYGEGLLVSRDGGATWAREAVAGSTLQIVEQAGTLFMAVAACPPTGKGECPMLVEESTNFGRTWSLTPAQPVGARSASSIAYVERTFLLTASDGTIYVFSQDPLVNGSPARQTMWVSTTYGATWRSRGVPCRAMFGTEASLAPSGAVWSVCGGEPGAGQQGKVVAVSYDQGATWRQTGACPGTGRHEDGNLCAGYAQDVVALSGSKALLANDRGGLSVTHDGGWRWSASGELNSGAGYLCEVEFLNSSDGVAVTTPDLGIWHTSNAGRSWHEVVARWQ
jgi:photosystem II stability/assembly factor-like uncharacterized protein